MPNVSISPLFNEAQYFDNDGKPLTGGKIFQYEAGSFTSQQTTYSDENGTIENPNPIILDSSGRTSQTLYLVNGSSYNLVLTLNDGTTILKYSDYVVGVQPSTQTTPGVEVWNTIAETPTYVNPTTFLISGVIYPTQFTIGNRVRITYDDTTTSYGTVTAVSFSGGNTRVTLNVDSGTLLSNMAYCAWSSLVQNGITVDSAGVSYKSNISYQNGSVGYEIKTNATNITNLSNSVNGRLDRDESVITATYSVINNRYTATPTYPVSSLTQTQVFVISFTDPNNNTLSELNISGTGSYPIYQYNSSGGLVNANITSGLTSQVAYKGGYYLLLDYLPSAFIAAPHGQQVFTSNGTFTVPSNVYNIKVTCVGGGGGSYYILDPLGGLDYIFFAGGGAASATKSLSVTPGQTYSVSIGLGALQSNTSVGQTGGATSFGITLCVANGGIGSVGGTVGVGDIVYAGGDYVRGGIASPGNSPVNMLAGSTWGGGQAPTGYGCGGLYNASSPQSGRNGVCVVEW